MRYVLVHGFSQSARSWDHLVPALAEHETVVALDVPDGLDFVGTAHALGDAGGVGTYVGYSMGGRLCLRLALDRPELVDRLVLVSATAGVTDDTARAARRDHDEATIADLRRLGVDAFLAQWIRQPMFATLGEAAAGLDDRKRANSVERLTHQLRVLGQGAQEPLWDRLGELRVPVTLLAGALDERYAMIARDLASRVPHSWVVVVEGAGHALHLELDPVTTVRLLTGSPQE